MTHKAEETGNAVPSTVEKYKKPINLDIRNNVILFLNGTDLDGNQIIAAAKFPQLSGAFH